MLKDLTRFCCFPPTAQGWLSSFSILEVGERDRGKKRDRGEGEPAKKASPWRKKALEPEGPRSSDRRTGAEACCLAALSPQHTSCGEGVSRLPPFLPLISSSPDTLSHTSTPGKASFVLPDS